MKRRIKQKEKKKGKSAIESDQNDNSMERNSALSNGNDYLKEEEEESYYRFTTV